MKIAQCMHNAEKQKKTNMHANFSVLISVWLQIWKTVNHFPHKLLFLCVLY